jgi:glycosyltransferase EpsF
LIEAQASGLPCFISDVVASEADIVPELVVRKSITDTPASWAETILSCHNGFCRKDTMQMISEHGYDVISEVKKLEREYGKIKEETK